MNITELAKEFLDLWAKKKRQMLSPDEVERFQELELLLGVRLPLEPHEWDTDPPAGSED